MLDTNIVLDQIDLLESPDGLTDVIIPYTVVEEVRRRSSPVHKRLRDIIQDANKR